MGGCARQKAMLAARSEKAERLSVEARQARERGDLQSAETLLTAALEQNPKDDDIRVELSELLLLNGKARSANQHLQILLDNTPDDPRVYSGLAEVEYLQQHLNEADQWIAQALDLDPRQERGLLLRAKIAQARGNTSQALDDLYQILDTEGEHADVRLFVARLHLQQGDSRLAAAVLRTLLESPNLNAVPRSKANWLLGRCYAEDERWQEAAAALAVGISSRHGSPHDWCLVAEICRRAGDLAAAKLAVENALQLAPEDEQSLELREALARETTTEPKPPAAVAKTSYQDDEDDGP
jgi:tetratricopeptide (TPR) repeat protein